jgi:hypothetical protein
LQDNISANQNNLSVKMHQRPLCTKCSQRSYNSYFFCFMKTRYPASEGPTTSLTGYTRFSKISNFKNKLMTGNKSDFCLQFFEQTRPIYGNPSSAVRPFWPLIVDRTAELGFISSIQVISLANVKISWQLLHSIAKNLLPPATNINKSVLFRFIK